MTSITAPTNDVTANAYYSTDNGSTYTAGATGGTVKAGSAEAGATSTSSVKYKSTVSLVATATSGYEFVGWYNAASGGTKLSDDSTYPYTLSTTGAKNVYARFIREEWTLKYGASGGSNWSSVNMTVSGNDVTGSMTLTEGQEFSFKLNKRIGNAETWYGANSASYSNITSTSFISNLSLNTSDGDIHMKGHAGTYTFTFNKSSNVLNVTVSYSEITITLIDNTNNHWLGNDNAIFYLDCSGYSGVLMTKGTNQWTASIPSNTRITNITFKRNNPDNTQTWDSWSWSNRDYSTSYTVN